MRFVFLSAALCVLISSCSLMDWVVGVDPTSGKVSRPGEAPVDAIGGILGSVAPWAAAALGLSRWGYIEMRKRQADQNFRAAVIGIDHAAKDPSIPKEKLYGMLTDASKAFANREAFEKAVAQIKKEYRKKNEI